MGLGDLFKANENKQLRQKLADLEALLTPEMKDAVRLSEEIRNREKTLADLQKKSESEIAKSEKTIASLKQESERLNSEIDRAKNELVETNEEVLMQSFGLYKPHFKFANATGYKEALDDVRKEQKAAIKLGNAATGNMNWMVNGSASQGKKMVQDLQKLLIRCFNCECDDVVDHVKFNNIEASEKRIHSSCEAISKLGAICSVSITSYYKTLKLKELHLAYEYQTVKEQEAQRLKQLRAEEREQAKLQKEIEEARKKIEKEEKHYENALAKLNQQISEASADEIPDLMDKKRELESKIEEIDESRKQIDYREANQKAGYVYIISNIGAFGEGVYKIGMTRRLDPMDRIDELGDASVPFDFDVHALIFSDDAPALETALHHAFENRKLNMVNARREFFRVSLDEIKSVIRSNYDKTVEFVDVAPAEQYRESLKMRSKV